MRDRTAYRKAYYQEHKEHLREVNERGRQRRAAECALYLDRMLDGAKCEDCGAESNNLRFQPIDKRVAAFDAAAVRKGMISVEKLSEHQRKYLKLCDRCAKRVRTVEKLWKDLAHLAPQLDSNHPRVLLEVKHILNELGYNRSMSSLQFSADDPNLLDAKTIQSREEQRLEFADAMTALMERRGEDITLDDLRAEVDRRRALG